MTTEPWTPGPWTWDEDNDPWVYQGRTEIDSALRSSERTVIDGVWHNDSTAGVGVSEADARLIALAPEMAELLATIARLDDGSLELVMTTAGLAAKARALLARARGETA